MRQPEPIRIATILLLPLVLQGCSGQDRPDRVGADSPPLRLELVHTFAGDRYMFGRIGAVTADDRGRVFVLDSQALEVVVLDPRGDAVEKYGRQGSGPGEFLALQPTLGWREDALVVADWRSGRLTFFDAAGGVAATTDWRATGAGTQVPSTLFTGGGALYGVSRAPQALRLTDWNAPPSDPPPPPQFRYVSVDASVSPTPLGLPEDLSPMPWPPSVDCGTSNGVIHILGHPFSSGGPLVAFTPTGLVASARRDSWTIDLLDATSGEVRGQIRREVPPLPVTDEFWEGQPEVQEARAIEREFGRLSGQGGTPCPLFEARPPYQPAIRTLISDESGRLWVESADPNGFAMTVLNLEGEVLGEAPMPARDRGVAPYVRGNRLYIVTEDDLGVQTVNVYEAGFGY